MPSVQEIQYSGLGGSNFTATLSYLYDPAGSGVYRPVRPTDYTNVEITGASINVSTTSPKASSFSNFTISGANGDCLSANSTRIAWSIQNLNTGTLYVKLGTTANTGSWNILLKADSAIDAGNGGQYVDEVAMWTGIVSASGLFGSGPRYMVWEAR